MVMTSGRVRGLAYESNFHRQSPFSSTSMAPSSGLLGGSSSKDDSIIGNNQQAADSSMDIFTRYANTNSGTKGFPNFYHQHHHDGFSQQNSAPGGFTDNDFPSLSPQPPSMTNRTPVFRITPYGPTFGGSRGSAGYGNFLKDALDSQPGFQIHSEDFPALPRSQDTNNDNCEAVDDDSSKDPRLRGEESADQQLGIRTYPNGTVTGIPSGMLNDQFGMAGLLTVIRAVSTETPVLSLALGQDLTKLGIDLNTTEKNLYQSFGGPLADASCRIQDIDCLVPPEYITNAVIGENLAPIKLNRYGEDLLFYLFFNFGGEVFQLAAAAELYNRDWRYHKEQRIWVTRAPGVDPVDRTDKYEKGTYYVFDPSSWRKVQRELHLELSKLEAHPMLPPQQQQQWKHPMPGVRLSS